MTLNFQNPTPEECRVINEAVALALGWKRGSYQPSWNGLAEHMTWTKNIGWTDTTNKTHLSPFPWSTDAGRAFADLWPGILKHSRNLYLGVGDASIPWNCAVWEMSEDLTMDYRYQTDTWALALCAAFLALMEKEARDE